MATPLITTKAKVKETLSLSVRLSDDRFRYFMEQVQEYDLRGLFTDPFYHDLLKNYTNAEYQKLINGEEYTDDDGNVIQFQGLHKVISHFWFSRYVIEGSVQDTGFDIVQKSSEFSDPISMSQRREISHRHNQMALSYYQEVAKYLDYQSGEGNFDKYGESSASEESRKTEIRSGHKFGNV